MNQSEQVFAPNLIILKIGSRMLIYVVPQEKCIQEAHYSCVCNYSLK